MYIKNLNWISEEAKEAELIVSDGINECISFCHPCNYLVGYHFNEPLHALDATNIMITQHSKETIILVENFKQHIIGTIIDDSEFVIKVGEIIISLDTYYPDWCSKGLIIEFDVARIDLW